MKFSIVLLLGCLGLNAQVPVLLELFTSEGCSSCPPADRLLEMLDKKQPFAGADLIVLSEHVDYWDGSWKDRFSSASLTKRQWEYAKYFGLTGIYTPQLVVDGQSEFVGSNGAEAKTAIEKALRGQKFPVMLKDIERNGDRVKLRVVIEKPSGIGKSGATIYVAIADSAAESQVSKGENAGRVMKHVAVVRSLSVVGSVGGGDFSKEVELKIPTGAGGDGLRVVAFVQDRATGKVLGIAQQKM